MSVNARAVVITGRGGPEVLALGQTKVRAPGPGELRVKVHSAALNRADVLQRKGFYPAPAGVVADVPGLEFAGVVAERGAGARRFEEGAAVMGIVAGGAMATHLVVHEREAIPVPAGMDLSLAGAIPEVFLTAFDALFVQGGLTMGGVALIHAAGSGVGTAAVQLARAAGARPIGTSRTQDKLERCRALGLEDGILVDGGTFAAKLEALVPDGVDVILDTVGAAYLEENVRALGSRGRLVVVGLLGGIAGTLPLAQLLAKRASIIGTVLRSRPLEEKATLAQRFSREVVPLFESKQLRPVVDRVMPMDQIAAAHAAMESNETFGKIVLTW